MSVLLDPMGHSPTLTSALAPRKFTSLDGARLGLIVSGKHNSDRLLDDIADLLGERFDLKSVMRLNKPMATRIYRDVLDKAAAECDVVVHAIGD